MSFFFPFSSPELELQTETATFDSACVVCRDSALLLVTERSLISLYDLWTENIR